MQRMERCSLVTISRENLSFNVRQDTTDERIVEEVFRVYHKHFDVEEQEIWYDFGAHIGAFTCYAASKGAYVNSYEPVPDNYELLLENIGLNQPFLHPIMVWPYAVTCDGRDVNMVITPYNYGACSTFMWTTGKMITVPSISVWEENIPDGACVKMDIEGSESEILPCLPLDRISKLVFEYHHWLVPKATEAQFKNLLKVFPNSVLDKTTDTWYNWR